MGLEGREGERDAELAGPGIYLLRLTSQCIMWE